MKKRPEWFKKFNDTVETTTKTFGQVLQKTGEELASFNNHHQVSEKLRQASSKLASGIADARDKTSLDQKLQTGKEIVKEGYQIAKDSELVKDAEALLSLKKPEIVEQAATRAKSFLDHQKIPDKIDKFTASASSGYGIARASIKPYFAPETPEELLLRTKDELLYVNSCILQISRNDSERFAERLGRAVTSKLTGAAASAGLLGIIANVGVAGTGTAISTLSGAAASNATLAWVGSLFGSGMAAGAVVTGGLMIAVSVGVYKFLGSDARQFEDLSDIEKQVVQATGLLIAAINENLADKNKTLSLEEAESLLETNLRPTHALLKTNADSIQNNLDLRNRIAFKQHAIFDLEKNVLDGFDHFIDSEKASRRMKYPAYAISGVIYALLNQEEVAHNRESGLVMDALRRSKNEWKNASDQEIGESLSNYDPDALKGLANNVKGIYHEMLFVDDYNLAHDNSYAVMHASTSHPGSDVMIFKSDTDEVLAEYQFKSTSSERAVTEHFERYPDIEVMATEEIASKDIDGVEASGFTNAELTTDVEQTLAAISATSIEDQVLESAGLTGLAAAGYQAIRVLNGEKAPHDIAQEGIKGAAVAGTTTALVAYFFS